jgi:hypothetical protein
MNRSALLNADLAAKVRNVPVKLKLYAQAWENVKQEVAARFTSRAFAL